MTSPPYLDARPEYPSPSLLEFRAIFKECRRVCTGTLLLNVGRLWRESQELMWWVHLVEAIKTSWPLRDTLIWTKPNANPIQGEILTNAHEYVFLFGDGFTPEEVRTEYAEGSVARMGRRHISAIGVKGDPGMREERRLRREGERRAPNPDGARAKSYVSITTGAEQGNKHPAPMALDLAKHLIKLSGGSRILDPFAGSGTTLLAARQLGLEAVGIELSPEYAAMASERLGQQSLFA